MRSTRLVHGFAGASLSSLSPMAPDPAPVLPLVARRDVHVPDFVSGSLVPDGGVLGDPTRPLVFYAVDADLELRVALAPGARVRLSSR